jgi:hypothetical protein
MYDREYWHLHDNDRQRLLDWVDKEGWKFEPLPGERSSRRRRRSSRLRRR